MSKQNKKSKETETIETPVAEAVETAVESVVETEQAAEKAEDFAEKSEFDAASDSLLDEVKEENTSLIQEKQKSGGRAIALLALLVALGVGAVSGANYYFENQKFLEVDNQIKALQQKVNQAQTVAAVASAPVAVEMPTFEAEKAQLAQLSENYQQAMAQVEKLSREQNAYVQQINALQSQIQHLGNKPAAPKSELLLSEADFLLNNALRKLLLESNVDAAKALLMEADGVLSKSSDPKAVAIRNAIAADLKTLAEVNKVDQNGLMQKLAELVDGVDQLAMLNNGDTSPSDNGEVSGSLDDWQKNIEKSADSFLNHFIRINDKDSLANEKAFVAPNQERYLRENIRLRLQIAMLAISRQQNELYKQSIETVASWVRSYFDTKNAEVKSFLAGLDSLAEQSIYVDAPNKLQSLALFAQSESEQKNITPAE